METKQKTITIETTVHASVEKVWNFWTEPLHITKWNQASDDWHSPFAENDLRKGGKFKTTMAAKDGSFSFDFEGVYSTVLQHERIEYTLTDGRKVSIAFTADGNKTHIRETFDVEESHTPEQQRTGWQAIMDSFRNYAETH